MSSSIRLPIVAPCYREESGLVDLHRRATLAAQAQVDADFELIVVNVRQRTARCATLERDISRNGHGRF